MKRNWIHQKPNPTLKTKIENKSKSQTDKRQCKHKANRAGSYFPKGEWQLSNPNRIKSILNRHKAKFHRNPVSKTGNKDHTRTLETVSNE